MEVTQDLPLRLGVSVVAQSTGAMLRVVMKKRLGGFPLKLRSFSDAGALGDSKTSEQSRGAFRGVEGVGRNFSTFCCCEHGKDRPAFLQCEAGRVAQR